MLVFEVALPQARAYYTGLPVPIVSAWGSEIHPVLKSRYIVMSCVLGRIFSEQDYDGLPLSAKQAVGQQISQLVMSLQAIASPFIGSCTADARLFDFDLGGPFYSVGKWLEAQIEQKV